MDPVRSLDGEPLPADGGGAMRIVVANSSDRWIGGIETYAGLLMPALLERGHDVLFLHERTDGGDRPLIPSLERVQRVSIAEARVGDAMAAVRAWKPDVLFSQWLDEPEHEAAVLDLAPAVLFAHAYFGTCISGSKTHRLPDTQPCDRRFGPACLALYFPRRCGGLSPRTALAEYGRQRRRQTTLHRYRQVVTFSAHMRREYLTHGLEPHRVTQLPPIYPSLLENAGGGSAPASPELRICFIGRIERLKGLKLLIEALPLVATSVGRPVRLVVAGDGPDAESCRAMAARIGASSVERGAPGVSVEFLGWMPQARCVDVTLASDVLAMPSLWPEPFGFTGAEAVRRGVPVAAFSTGAIPEWLADGVNGALAPADPPTAAGLADAVRRASMIVAPRPSGDDVRAGAVAALTQHVNRVVDVLSASAADAGQVPRVPPAM